MGRTIGSPNRMPEDKVSVLRAWLSMEKIRRSLEGGCCWCSVLQTQEVAERAPFKLSFLHRDPATQEFSISQAPNLKGMTKVRLELEIAKCDLICRRCLGQILETKVRRPERMSKRRNLMSKRERREQDREREFQACLIKYPHN